MTSKKPVTLTTIDKYGRFETYEDVSHKTATSEEIPPENNSSIQPSPISKVIQELEKIDTLSPEADLNRTTISDGKGGRITLNDVLEGLKGIDVER